MDPEDRPSKALYKNLGRFVIIAVTIFGLLPAVILFLTVEVFGRSYSSLGLKDDVIKLTYQFLLVAILGGAAALSYQLVLRNRDLRERNREHERELHEQNRKMQRDLHAEVITAYNIAKKVRRLLHARAQQVSASGDDMILHSEYDRQMETLIDAQLEIESARIRVSSDTTVFIPNEDLKDNLDKVEEYLNEIISEYEDKNEAFGGNPATKKLAELPKLQEFLKEHPTGETFKSEFQCPFHKAIDILTKMISAEPK